MGHHLLTASLAQGEILLVTIQGNLVKENLAVLKEDIREANAFIRTESERALRPLPVLADLSKLESTYEPEALLLLAGFEKNNRPYVQRTVCFGANAKIKFAGEIVSALSSRDNISFFTTKEEALAFLRG